MKQASLWAGALVALLAGYLPASAEDLSIEHVRYRLDNGLEVLLHKDSSIPQVAVNVWYHVGSGDEEVGRSGFAHLFEHMLFQGSAHVGSDQHFAVLRAIGGNNVNGSTNTDRTNYYEMVPSHELETALWLESDRMGYLLGMLTEPSLKNQIDVVRNERRQRYETVPYGKALFELSLMMHPEGHPYRYLTIGKSEDLEAATLEDVRNFYSKWYTPANATLTLAGDFEIDEAKRLVDKWFGNLPASQRPEHKPPAVPKVKHQRKEITDPLSKLERVDYAWHSPAYFHSGDAELDVLANVLGRSGSGRLYKRLVIEKELAQSVAVFQGSRMFSSYFQVMVIAKSGADLAAIERIINAEIENVRKKPITMAELKRAVTAMEAQFVWGLEGLMARAELLQTYNHFVGDPGFLSKDLDRWRNVTPAAVRESAETYLGADSRVELVTRVEPDNAAKAAPAQAAKPEKSEKKQR